ncbi:hypothetical protein EIN_327940 [Entamoeba invadens IP1]|uniref:Uncharacterized protein n=1 Tax=Entamoeba invadens IP1 TaxID=370355 RepID=A0A0A1TXM2_ENTIV|nr:hypothetical protein EIN_327940 [Entamoeba invadens IP1]ELP86137.1 hypothetical protein EIN_327940 [Entamoeba invadens IP1]|eukprot:XP_004185483.1 hypothetical protein EIN_327940 [Entamoeba invadens IP1]
METYRLIVGMLLVVFVTAGTTSLTDMRLHLDKKYERLQEIEERSIDANIKSAKLSLSQGESSLKKLTEKQKSLNALVQNATNALIAIDQNITSNAAAISTLEVKLEAAKKEKSPETKTIAQDIERTKRVWNDAKLRHKEVETTISGLHQRLQRISFKMSQRMNFEKDMTNAIKIFEGQKTELVDRLKEERNDEERHRTIYLTALETNKKLNAEAKKIENALGEMTGSARSQAHQRLIAIKSMRENDRKIIRLQKRYISIIEEKGKSIKAAVKRMMKEGNDHKETIKSANRKIEELKKSIEEWKKMKNEKRVNELKNSIEEVKYTISVENDRFEKVVDEFVTGNLYARIHAVHREIKELRTEKKIVKMFLKGMKGKRCAVDQKAIQSIRKAMVKEQKKLEERVKNAKSRIEAIQMRITTLKRQKREMRETLRKVSLRRLNELRKATKLEKKNVGEIKKELKNLFNQNKEGKVQAEVERMKGKLVRATTRYHNLREIRDEADRDVKQLRVEEINEKKVKLSTLKHLIRELNFRRKQTNRKEQKNLALMALEHNDCFKRRKLWKQVRAAQEERKEVSERLDRVSKKYIKLARKIRNDEKKVVEELKQRNQALVAKKEALERGIAKIKENLKKENNEKKYRDSLEQITFITDEMKEVDEELVSVRNEMRRSKASLILEKYVKKFEEKKYATTQVKELIRKLRRHVSKATNKIIQLESIYEQTVYDKRDEIKLKLDALKSVKAEKEKKLREAEKRYEKVSGLEAKEAQKVVGYLKAMIDESETVQKEFSKLANKRTTEYKTHYERLAQMCMKDAVEMKRRLGKYTEKVERFQKKMIAFESEKTPCKVCVELGRRAKESLAMTLDNNMLLKNVQERCKFFPENERPTCYSTAFKVAKYAANLFDPEELKVKQMCVVLKKCSAV